MAKPYLHAISSAKKYGGKPDDYLLIHQLMDSSKSSMGDNRHRAATHNAWFIGAGGPLELIFGVTITNSDGKQISVRDIGEQHILEDFGMRFIPTLQDYLENMEMRGWMSNQQYDIPNSYRKIAEKQLKVRNGD